MVYFEPDMDMDPFERVILVARAKRALLHVYSEATNLPITADIRKNFESPQVGHHNLPIPGKFYTTAPMIHQYLHRKAEYIPLRDWSMKTLIKVIRDCYGDKHTHDKIHPHTSNPNIDQEEYRRVTGSGFKLHKIYAQQRIFYLPTLEGIDEVREIHDAFQRGGERGRALLRIRPHNHFWTRGIASRVERLEDFHTRGQAREERIALIQQEGREEDIINVMTAVEDFNMDAITELIGRFVGY